VALIRQLARFEFYSAADRKERHFGHTIIIAVKYAQQIRPLSFTR
jgi:hypothetical protein